MTDHSYRQKRDLMATFWKEQRSAYGNRWDQYGPVGGEDFMHWLETVKDFSTEALRQGIFASRKRTNEFPTSLPEFRGLIQASQRAYVPDNGAAGTISLEATGRKLLAGKFSGAKNRIVQRHGIYRHQRLINGEWVDNPELDQDGLLPMHRGLVS